MTRCLYCVDMSQKHSDAAQLKKEGEKKKAKSTVTWNGIKYDGSVKKKKQFEGAGVQVLRGSS